MSLHDQTHDLDLIAVYALGALPEEQARAVADLVKQCPECRKEYTELRDAACCIGWAAELPISSMQAPRPQVKAAIMREVRGAKVPSPSAARRYTWSPYLVAAAAILIAISSVIANASLRTQDALINDRNVRLLQLVRTETMQHDADREMLAALVAADAQRFPIDGGEIVSYHDTLLLVMHQLPPLPKGKVYQTWTIALNSTTLTPSALFTPDQQGWAIVALPERPANVSAVGLSVEPETGSKAPTSAPLFLRKLS